MFVLSQMLLLLGTVVAFNAKVTLDALIVPTGPEETLGASPDLISNQ